MTETPLQEIIKKLQKQKQEKKQKKEDPWFILDEIEDMEEFDF